MRCSNCGKDTPFGGKVCNWCGADKSKDQQQTVFCGFFGLVGGALGYFIAEGVVGGFIGLVFGCILGVIVAEKASNPSKKVPAASWVLLSLVFGLFIWWIIPSSDNSNSSSSSRPATSESERHSQAAAAERPAGKSELQVDGSVIRVGDLADDVMPRLNPYKVSTKATTDPSNSESLAVKHSYRINGTSYTVEFRRRDDPGPYRVFAITTGEQQTNNQSTSNLRTVCKSQEKQDVAKDVLTKLTTPTVGEAMVLVSESNGSVSYTFADSWWATIRPRLNEFVHSIADADACLQGTARRIDFYRANGLHIGFADPESGVKVLD